MNSDVITVISGFWEEWKCSLNSVFSWKKTSCIKELVLCLLCEQLAELLEEEEEIRQRIRGNDRRKES